MRAKNIAFWLLFLAAGIWAQRFLPGVDMFAPGILASLQEKRPAQTLWLTIIAIFIQEGVGTLNFGVAIVWYLSVFIIYFIGRWLFEAENVLFIFLLSVCLGGVHFGLLSSMQILQGISVSRPSLPVESLLQVVVFLSAWWIVKRFRKPWVPHGAAI